MANKIMEVFIKMLEKTMNPMPNHCIECDKPTMEILCSECMNKEDDYWDNNPNDGSWKER